MFRSRIQRIALAALLGLGLALVVQKADAVADTSFVDVISQDVLFDETFDVQTGGTLAVDLGSEAVTVRTVRRDRARVIVEGRGRDAADEFERRRFTARVEGGRLVIRTQPRRRSWFSFGGGSRNVRFDVTIEVPRRFSATVDVGSGAVSVGDLQGDLAIDTGSGAVRVGDVEGDVAIDTGSGAVRTGRIEGDVVIDTGSGGVAVGDARGEVYVNTGSGGAAVTVSGGHPVRVDTGSGGVNVRVPQRSGWDVRLDGSRVEIDDRLSFQGQRDRRDARGRIGGGGPVLDVNTGSGGITIAVR